MEIAIACVVGVGVLLFILSIRSKDLPAPEPVSPFQHLDERKAAIYENLRDLQFEYRVGKLSDEDYQHTKLDLQKHLAVVMAEIDRIKKELLGAPPTAKPRVPANVCPSCGATFQERLKFCGECGKSMRLQA